MTKSTPKKQQLN